MGQITKKFGNILEKAVNKLKQYPFGAFLIFVCLDIALIAFSVLLAFLLRFDAQIPIERMDNLKGFLVLAVFLTIPIFFFSGIYKISWSYLSLTDLPYILWAVIVSSSVLGASLFILKFHPLFEGFPRSIIFLYGVLLFISATGLRFAKRIYWQLIKPKIAGEQRKRISPFKVRPSGEYKSKTVLVTGGAGYIGSVLCRQLLGAGFRVKVIDKLMYGGKSIKKLKQNPNFQFIQGDILDIQEVEKHLFDVDAVVHLAAIVGEAACVAKKDVAIRTNYSGTVYLVRLCKAYGIKRFVYLSTCSAYGKIKEGELAKEDSVSRPVDFYGETKMYAERELINFMNETFSPTILRLSTVYGLSPRMRFDLVVNILSKKAVLDGEILIFGGDQWRPLIHVSDLARAIVMVLKAPLSKVGNQVFNVGGNEENYRISQLGELVKEVMPSVQVKTIDNIVGDRRSYKVDFTKIEKVLGFKAHKTVKDGILEITRALKEGQFPNPEDKSYYNHLF